jgi:hypothetical protein
MPSMQQILFADSLHQIPSAYSESLEKTLEAG